MRRPLLAVAAVALGVAAAPSAASADVVWLCKPGDQPNPCRESLATTVFDADGSSRVERPRRPREPGVDCFYVYPTVSDQAGSNATKAKDPPLVAIARFQASRFSNQCRVFAPVYRQRTIRGLFSDNAVESEAAFRVAYADVLEAWREFLDRHSKGPFALIGHSQGTFILRQLIRNEIDTRRSLRRRLVSAILLGGDVLVANGRRSAGDFENVPACRRARQTGCVIAYSTFDEEPPPTSVFARSPRRSAFGSDLPFGPSYEVLCTNPGALASNRRKIYETLFRTDQFPGSIGFSIRFLTGGAVAPGAPTPWVRPVDRYSGACMESNGANWLDIEPVGASRDLRPSPTRGWGLHLADVNLAHGNLVSLVRSQARAKSCLPSRVAIGRRGIGKLRLGRTRTALIRRQGPPVRRTRWTLRWCVRGTKRRVTVVFSRRSRAGKARLIVSKARGHRVRRVGAGTTIETGLRRLPRVRALIPSVAQVAPGSTRIVGTRGSRTRVTFAGVAARSLLRNGAALRRYLRRAGV